MPHYIDKPCKRCNRPAVRNGKCERHMSGNARLITRVRRGECAGPHNTQAVAIVIDGRTIPLR